MHNDVLTYILLDQNNLAISSFGYNPANLTISGTVPNADAGTFDLQLRCRDSLTQIATQYFSWTFLQNQNPTPSGIDLSTLTFTIGEGQSSEHIIPSGVYIDSDGDNIYYEAAFFNDFSALDFSWVSLTPGYEGDAKLIFTNIPVTDKTGFQIFLSDGIGSASNFFELSFNLNKRPVPSVPTITLDIYRNLNLTLDLTIDMNAYFTDPESDVLTFSFQDVPVQLNIAHQSGSIYQFTGEFDISVVDMNFTFKANDGVSLPSTIIVQIIVQDCHNKCDRCFGPTENE